VRRTPSIARLPNLIVRLPNICVLLPNSRFNALVLMSLQRESPRRIAPIDTWPISDESPTKSYDSWG